MLVVLYLCFLSASFLDVSNGIQVCIAWPNPPTDQGWVYQLNKNKIEVEQELNITIKSTITVSYFEPAPFINLIRSDGCQLIFACGPLYASVVSVAATAHPEVYFVVLGGTSEMNNISSSIGRMYQARYLEGIMAGLITNTSKIGFVNSFEFSQSLQHINAFYLGLNQSNPNVSLSVVHVGSFLDPTKSAEAVQILYSKGIDYVAVFQDDTTPEKTATELGIYSGGFHTDIYSLIGGNVLTSSTWNWTPTFKKFIAFAEGFPAYLKEKDFPGLNDSAVLLAPFHPTVPQYVRDAVRTQESRLINSTDEVIFCGSPVIPHNPLAPNGCLTKQQILDMDWSFSAIIDLGPVELINQTSSLGGSSTGSNSAEIIVAIVVPIIVVVGVCIILLPFLILLGLFIYHKINQSNSGSMDSIARRKLSRSSFIRKGKRKGKSLSTFGLEEFDDEHSSASSKRRLIDSLNQSTAMQSLIHNPRFIYFVLSFARKIQHKDNKFNLKILIKSFLLLNYLHHKTCRKMISYIMIQEIKSDSSFSNIFRDSLGAHVFSQQSKLTGTQYLTQILSPTIEEVMRNSEVGEDLRKMDRDEVEYAGRLHLLLTSQKLFVTIIKSVNDVPKELRLICKDIKEELEKDEYSDTDVDYHVAISSLMFLRFINPALISPDSFGIMDENEMDSSITDFLLLLSKVLQNLANQRHFEKEEYMQKLNEFIDENEKSVTKWIDALVSIDETDVLAEAKYEGKVKKQENKAGAAVMKFIESNQKALLDSLRHTDQFTDLVDEFQQALAEISSDSDSSRTEITDTETEEDQIS